MELLLIFIALIWLCTIQSKQSELKTELDKIQKELKQLQNASFEPVIKQDKEYNDCEASSEASTLDETFDTPYENSTNDENNAKIPDKPLIETKENKNDVEKLFLGNIFNKIGALAIFVGLIIFIKLISPYIIFTPWIKLSLGFLTGFAFIGASLFIRTKEKMRNYSEVLLGVGFGALFITTYCGSTILELLDTPVVFTIATALLLAAYYLADKLKTVSMLSISLIAGYLNPFFINRTFDVEPDFLLGYLIFVNLLGVIYTFRNKNRSIVNVVNLVLTSIFSAFAVHNILAPSILWAIYLIYGLISKSENTLLNCLNFSVFAVLTLFVFKENVFLAGIPLLAAGLLYVIAAIIKFKQKAPFKNYIHLFLLALAASVYFFTTEKLLLRVYIWSLEAIILAYFAQKYKFKELTNWVIGSFSAAFVCALFIDDVIYTNSIVNYIPVWNIRLFSFAPIVISGFLSSKILGNSYEEQFKKVAYFLKFGYLSVLYLYIGFEANAIINKYFIEKSQSANFIKNMTNVILGFMYTIQFKRLHNVLKFSLFKFASLALGTISLFYLLSFGYNYTPKEAFIPVINIRFLAFIMAVGASILYAKLNKKDFYKYLAIALGFYLMHIEINDTIDRFILTNAEYLISVGWVLYAGVVTALGIFKDEKYLKFSGIALCILAIIRIFVFDLAHVDILYKFIAFLILGIILLLLSYFYNKTRKL